MSEWAGKRVAIAGAGQGIGAACAHALTHEGARLVLCSRTASDLAEVAAAIGASGGEAHVVAADLATDAGAQAFAEGAFAARGGVDLGLICVGIAQAPLPFSRSSRALLLEQLEGNALAPALGAAALLRQWSLRPAPDEDRQLLFLSSLVTRRPPFAGTAPYTAGKAALESFVRAIAEEAWPSVRANALALGAVATRLHQRAGTPREVIESLPSAGDIAPLVLLAAGQRARGLTGRTIDFEALASDPDAALHGDGRLATVNELQRALAESEPLAEAEPGRRPSPRVRRALRATADSLHRYPHEGGALAARLAALHGAAPETIALSGGGASELLERCLRALCVPGDEVVSPFPTFELLSALCSREGLRHRPVPSPRTAEGLFGPHAAAPLLAAVGPRTRLVYVASPDNPTGVSLSPAEESTLYLRLPPRCVLVIDEAWAGPPRGPYPEGQVVRLRSFSKLNGLAALRIGYAVGARGIVSLLRRLQLPYPLGAPQLAAALAVLDEPERGRRAELLLARERQRLAVGLRALGLAVSEGEAPVLLLRAPSGNSVGRLFFALQAAGATVQEAHWDPLALVLALGSRAANRRHLAACARALAPS